MNFLQLMKVGLAILLDAWNQYRFTKSFIKPLVQKHCNRLGYQLSKSEKKKVLFYYPLYTVIACGEMYLALKGRGITRGERRRLSLVASMATRCDDLIDEHGWTRDQIFELLANHFEEDGLDKKAQLLVALNKELNSFWPLKQPYLQQLKLALEWQSTSGQQLNPTINLDQIVDICRKKNGNTSLMFATLLNEDWTEEERQFIYQSAMVGQLTNDSFDIWVDSHAGINTFINRSPTIAAAKSFFIDECKKLHRDVMNCDVPESQKKECIRRMSCMHAYALVAFDHLQVAENKYGLPMDWKKPTRQEAVTVMAFLKNQLKLLKYIQWLAKQ